MPPRIVLRLKRNPSALANLFRAFATYGRSRSHAPPLHEATLLGVAPDPERIAAFNEICDSPRRDTLHILYPFALCYPLAMRVLSSRAMPFSMMQVLNTRNTIAQMRPILADETLSLRCRTTPWRAAAKGCELDLVFDVANSGQRIWRCTATYLIRGASAATADPVQPRKGLRPLEAPELLATWRLQARNRVRFARVSGDSNGIHICPWYARRFGFERDFAQPLRVVAQCVDSLPSTAATVWPRRLEFHLKGPVYYGSNLTLRGSETGGQYRFDLHREADTRPCVVGRIGAHRTTAMASNVEPAEQPSTMPKHRGQLQASCPTPA